MTIPNLIVLSITLIVSVLGVLATVLILMVSIYVISRWILDYLFELSSLRLVVIEFRKYYLRGIRDGDIQLTPLMKNIIKIKNGDD